ncbi:MAG TPA: ECF transporter S component [Lachnospiraceae bacterium]|nr:ECF transporter S component [Lachnospiraceae bacterium]
MKKEKDTKFIVISALMAAFACVATMVIKIPTPTFGYIHLGDALVLLCGIILGPLYGGLAAGIGSMLADLFSGYASFAPATFVIKAGTALIAGFLFRELRRIFSGHKSISRYTALMIAGAVAEFFMVIGYFVYEIFLAMLAAGAFTGTTFAAGVSSSATGIPFNIVQGFVGIVISLLLLPILEKIPDARKWME